MTDCYNCLIVVLEEDMCDDDAAQLMAAIKMLRGVLSVNGHVTDSSSYVADQRANQRWREKLFDLLRDDVRGDTR